jgi:peptidoglycan L-alanyl-D-glutamate endopeptidase CwlK
MSIKLLVSIIVLSVGAFFIVRNKFFHNNPPALVQSSFKKLKVIPETNTDSLPACVQKLFTAYPGKFITATKNSIIWFDSTEMVFDDNKHHKSFQALLDSADLEDQVCSMKYPRDGFTQPKKNNDAGRVRYEPFFRKMYGSTERQVKANLVEITWLPKHVNQKIKISKVNGVADKLKKISEELDKHPELAKYLKNPGGTFKWRTINGTNRLSTHSFGITIDINTSFSNYWQWDHKEWKTKGEQINITYTNRIPLTIVQIFEKYGFIWGGKWYHYDTMHFEYRPELL